MERYQVIFALTGDGGKLWNVFDMAECRFMSLDLAREPYYKTEAEAQFMAEGLTEIEEVIKHASI